MKVEHLVGMANQIGRFYSAFPNRDEALAGTAGHIRRFWDPRMRATLLRHVEAGGAGLDPLVTDALRAHWAEVAPAPAAGGQ